MDRSPDNCQGALEIEKSPSIRGNPTRTDGPMKAAVAFFLDKLDGIKEPTAPFGIVDGQLNGAGFETVSRAVDRGLANRLRDYARRSNVGTEALFHAACALVVSRTSGKEDIVYGAVLADRADEKPSKVSPRGSPRTHVPLRLCISSISTMDLASRIERELDALWNYRNASPADIEGSSRTPLTRPLFTTALDYRRTDLTVEADDAQSRLDYEVLPSGETKRWPIQITVHESSDGFTLEVQTDDRISPRRMAGYFCEALRSLTEALERAPQTPALTLSVLPEIERRQVVETFNATQAVYPESKLTHELFEGQAERTPQAVAIAYEGRSLTYAQLNAKANRLAHHLRDRGVGPDQPVGLCVERSLDMVVGLLGILKAGGAYVPLDPAYPAERLAHMLEDADPQVLLTQERLRARLPHTSAEVIALDTTFNESVGLTEENLPATGLGLTARHLVYVIYTSGSTGCPKGTGMAHRSMVNLIEWHRRNFSDREGQRVLQFAALSFDVAFQEILSTLCTGSTLILPREAVRRDAKELADFLIEHSIQRLFIPPVMLKILTDHFELTRTAPASLQDVIVAGEQLRISPELTRLFKHLAGCRLHNHYGPTETHVVTTLTLPSDLDKWPVLPAIGQPVFNTQIYVLDHNCEPTPVEVPGEIYIGGAGVARGYLNRPELTAERFVADPFSRDPQARMYKTGDLGRWRADGSIEYLGRNDCQVKIRGFRIELEEIEAQLSRHARVKEAVVVAREDVPGEKRLVAYLISRSPPAGDAAPNAEDMRAHLKGVLPEHMIPSAFVILESFPLTPNGKLDRRALPAPKLGAYASQLYEAPQGEVEEILAGIWERILHVERVGRQDNFFELGGYSILGMQLIKTIAETWEIQLPVLSMFQAPTVWAMAQSIEKLRTQRLSRALDGALAPEDRVAHLKSNERIDFVSIGNDSTAEGTFTFARRRPDEAAPLTFQQEWLWNLMREDPESHFFCGSAWRIRGNLDVERLSGSLGTLKHRHEPLRTRIVVNDGIPQQQIDAFLERPLRVEDLSNLSSGDAEMAAQRISAAYFGKRADLSAGPLFECTLLKLAERDHVLIIAIHHIVIDAISIGILFRELWSLYKASSCKPHHGISKPAMQYADYAAWQRSAHPKWLSEHASYWEKKLKGASRIQWPIDGVVRATPSCDSPWLEILFGNTLSGGLINLSRREKADPALIILALYSVLIFCQCNQRDFVVPFNLSGRHLSEQVDMVGYLAHLVLLRVELTGEETFIDLLNIVTREFFAAADHIDFGRIASERPDLWTGTFLQWSSIRPNDLREPLAASEGESGLVVEEFGLGNETMDVTRLKSDITLTFLMGEGGIGGYGYYRTDLFSRKAMERFSRELLLISERLISSPQTRIAVISKLIHSSN